MSADANPSTLTKSSAPRPGLAALLLLAALGHGPARSEDVRLLPDVIGAAEIYGADPNSGLALGGRDPVSYHTERDPSAGAADREASWAGLAWRFARDANRAAFLRSPEAFAPRIGGYDAEAAGDGRLVGADPDIFLTAGGRVYLFRTAASRARFAADPGAAARAEAAWLRMRPGLVRG